MRRSHRNQSTCRRSCSRPTGLTCSTPGWDGALRGQGRSVPRPSSDEYQKSVWLTGAAGTLWSVGRRIRNTSSLGTVKTAEQPLLDGTASGQRNAKGGSFVEQDHNSQHTGQEVRWREDEGLTRQMFDTVTRTSVCFSSSKSGRCLFRCSRFGPPMVPRLVTQGARRCYPLAETDARSIIR
ncbi:hypothetical protein LX32DRAFT_222967 [Colletotrichum zoysiae]|uniref:Uncharacterized protein n=1 Tax=Colletotrichum zoysiae TaxID=1216348 RepID=A0AAD9H4Z3_9PEZI|nr:hypothetical protein LX32DRAFT_222967 [Colletotrichum zoysiae]